MDDQIAPVITFIPANVTVSCAAALPAFDDAAVIATDNCVGAIAITHADVVTAGSCVNRYSVARTYTATDVCGNNSSQTQTITVDDQIAPVITCNNTTDQIVDANIGTTYKHALTGWDATATDVCGTPSVAATLSGVTNTTISGTLDGAIFNEGVTTVTWIATDACGNTSPCTSFTVTVYAAADLAIAKTVITPAIAGQSLTYQITVDNNGPAAANNVVINDAISAFASPQFATNPGGPWSPWVSPYPVGTMVNGGSTIIYIKGDLAINQCSDVSNTATVASTTRDDDMTNNTVTITTTVLDQIVPSFDLPSINPLGYCVEKIIQATYNPGMENDPILDLTFVRPDYYQLSGSPEFDLLNMNDNCTLPANPISWVIHFADGTPDLPGTGQLSLAGEIHFPVGINRITYTLSDAALPIPNKTVLFVDIEVKPRPTLTKDP